jgi:hypothetical protein
VNTDFIYWTFSAAAQCVSTFVALLLTGYALVLSQIDSARDHDNSLEDIHDALRTVYHTRLTVLAWLTASSVGLSLLVVWLTRTNEPPSGLLMALAACMDALAIIAGLGFVVAIIDPRKFQKLAKRELEEQLAEEPTQETAPSAEFFKAFRKLERTLREQVTRRQEAHTAESTVTIASANIRQLGDMLLQAENITEELNAELVKLNRYRNLLFHGHAKEADAKMIDRTRVAIGRVRQLA